VPSEETNKERQKAPAVSAEVGKNSKLPRISDVDMFSSGASAKQSTRGDTADVHASGEMDVISPSVLSSSAPADVHNTTVLTGTGTALHTEALNDVEPDGSRSSAGSEPSHGDQNLSHSAIVTVLDSTSAVHCNVLPDDGRDQMMPYKRQKLPTTALQTDDRLSDDGGIAAASHCQSDDIVLTDTEESNSITGDNLVTQSSAADESFTSCAADDSDSSVVNVYLLT